MISALILWLSGIVGPKLAKPVLIIVSIIAIVLAFNVARCAWQNQAVRQAKQTTRSGEAIADAAQSAVATITNATARDASIDSVVAGAVLEIDAAATQEEKRAAAFNAVCALPEYAGDPKCAE
jgi:hypothetical protein